MKFWNVEIFNKEKNREETFLVQAPYEKDRIIEILKEVHPEYDNIRIKKTKKPAGMRAWPTEEST